MKTQRLPGESDGEQGGGTAQRGSREFSLVSQFSMLSDLTSQPQRFRSDCSESRITFRIELLLKAPLKSTRPSFSSDDSEQRKRWGSRASPGLSLWPDLGAGLRGRSVQGNQLTGRDDRPVKNYELAMLTAHS